MGTKVSKWRPPNNRIFEKGTIFFGHPVFVFGITTSIPPEGPTELFPFR